MSLLEKYKKITTEKQNDRNLMKMKKTELKIPNFAK